MTALVGMVDPARAESKTAVAEAQAAHIRVRMITGDDVTTGAAIAEQVGIGGEAILGADFAAMSDEERLARIDDIGVIGRVAPEHKVLLVDTLKAKGEVVAMTGDGVNDAPAIKAADIGIAMGSGTEVAKNAGRMILSDDNFATIVYAVEQGRKIFDNLTKYIRFVLVLLVVFVLTFLGASLFNIAAGAPFNPAQVLWIHFFVNAAFGFALGFDLETPGLMDRVPKPRGESVLTPRMLVIVGSSGLAITVGLLLMIELGTEHFHSLAVGNSIAFTTFAFCLVVAALECRSETGTILTTATFDSKQMNRALIVEVVLAVLTTQMDALRRLLDTTDLNVREFGWALVPAVVLFILWELGKLLARRHHVGASQPAPQQTSAPCTREGQGPTGRSVTTSTPAARRSRTAHQPSAAIRAHSRHSPGGVHRRRLDGRGGDLLAARCGRRRCRRSGLDLVSLGGAGGRTAGLLVRQVRCPVPFGWRSARVRAARLWRRAHARHHCLVGRRNQRRGDGDGGHLLWQLRQLGVDGLERHVDQGLCRPRRGRDGAAQRVRLAGGGQLANSHRGRGHRVPHRLRRLDAGQPPSASARALRVPAGEGHRLERGPHVLRVLGFRSHHLYCEGSAQPAP